MKKEQQQVWDALKYDVRVDKDGTRRYFLNGNLHRTDGPAVEFADGAKEWWLNGKLHREDGPAIEWLNGDRVWYINGLLHREVEFNAITK